MTILESVSDAYVEYMANGDPRVTNWLLMEGPLPTLILVAAYVLFVKVVGPAIMQNKKPYDLRYPMFLYNMVLVISNIYLVSEAFRVLSRGKQSFTCSPEDKMHPDSVREILEKELLISVVTLFIHSFTPFFSYPEDWIEMAELGWWFYFTKFIEFADTIFFVLRKKFNHISTLHVVHHATVPIAVWGGLRIEPGSYNYFFPLLNTIVHTVMYTYYGLAALGPSVQRFLWWKKYLTTFQMMQFVMVFIYVIMLMFSNCKVSKFIIYLNIFLASLFLFMFFDYFKKTYLKKMPRTRQQKGSGCVENNHSLATENMTLNFNSRAKNCVEKKIG